MAEAENVPDYSGAPRGKARIFIGYHEGVHNLLQV